MEVFPPKKDTDFEMVKEAALHIASLKPSFMSVTYGAGGSTKGNTIKLASEIQKQYQVPAMAHLTCVCATKESINTALTEMKQAGIENILALRGDISPDIKPNGRFHHANELIRFIYERYDFNIIAACYPEGHPESKNIVADIENLKRKADAGASQLVTQLFLDNDYFYSFQERVALAGINLPIEAGIMPVTNKKQIERMVKLCGVHLPKKFMRVMDKYENNPEALRDAGIAYAIDQIVDLTAHGADGIHLYTMNNPYVARKIYEAVHSMLKV